MRSSSVCGVCEIRTSCDFAEKSKVPSSSPSGHHDLFHEQDRFQIVAGVYEVILSSVSADMILVRIKADAEKGGRTAPQAGWE